MESHHPVGCGRDLCETDHGPKLFTANLMYAARQNQNFRTAFWTGDRLQMTLMHIPGCGEIGLEMHPDTDQLIRVEEGQAFVRAGACREKLDFHARLGPGEAVFIPRGTWHNVSNAEIFPLKLSSLYAPPQHPAGTIHRTKKDAEGEEH